MTTIRTFARSHPLLVAVIALAIGLAGIWFVLPDDDTTGTMMLVRLGLTVIMFAIIAVTAGTCIIKPTAKGIGFALKKAIYLLALALALGAFALWARVIQGESVAADWPLQLLLVILLCLFVGAFEEGLFRGIILNALLARMGETRRGLAGAVVVSAFLFGVVHVIPSIVHGQVADGLGIAQAALKTVQTGIVGVFLAAVFLKTRNLWPVVLVHGLNDLFAMVSAALFNSATTGQYVSSDPIMSVAMVVAYVAITLLYIPVVVSSVRMLKRIDVPCRGPFAEDWS